MKSDLECLVCLLKQALNTAKMATEDKTLHRKVLDRVAEQIQRSDLTQTPATISKPVYEIVADVTGTKDPYRDLKHRTNLEALQLLPELEANIAAADYPLSVALHLAVAGNIIDLGIGHDFDLINDVKAILNTEFAIDNTENFRRRSKLPHPFPALLRLHPDKGKTSKELPDERLDSPVAAETPLGKPSIDQQQLDPPPPRLPDQVGPDFAFHQDNEARRKQ